MFLSQLMNLRADFPFKRITTTAFQLNFTTSLVPQCYCYSMHVAVVTFHQSSKLTHNPPLFHHQTITFAVYLDGIPYGLLFVLDA
mmetsp:Transcript_21074/g.32166  ORF Transcript_21074/g.32166 Transcript_21074/m.32166 type:complete len:85 (+) Transcript_21074:189-443(+)